MKTLGAIAIGGFTGAVVGFFGPILYSGLILRENNPQIGLVSVFVGVPVGVFIGCLVGWLFRPTASK